MKKVIAAKNFTANGNFYIAGDEIDGLTFEQIAKLNEKGFIEPLSIKDLALIKRDIEKKEKIKEEL